jgi:3-hydroxyisobutyrate dehydrogenase
MVEEDFPTSFSANLARKDAALVLDAAEAHALRMRITESVVARFDEAIKAGHGEEDMAAVYRAARPD